MFSNPVLTAGERFPTFPETVAHAITELGVELYSSESILSQAAGYSLRSWLAADGAAVAADPEKEAHDREVLRSMGLVDAIAPSRDSYDYGLLDGGSKPVYDWRLGHMAQLLDDGLALRHITVFSGQRLRFPYDDHAKSLEVCAAGAYNDADEWGKRWLETELQKSSGPEARWDRAFATEHEIAILALLQKFGKNLRHTGTRLRQNVTSVHPDIPASPVQYEDFSVGEVGLHVLNGRAVIREFRRQLLPAEEARPTGRSCFYEWVSTVAPERNASALLLTHNPNIYRTWLDFLLGAQAIDRGDLVLEGAGASVEPGRSNLYILRALGRLFVNFYNHEYSYDGAAPVLSQLQ